MDSRLSEHVSNVFLIFLTDDRYFVGDHSVLFHEYDSYCRRYGGETINFEKKEGMSTETFNELGYTLYRWSKIYQMETTLRIEAFYFWTAFNFSQVS